MSILERFSTIIKANINDLLDRAEDPAKMMDQYMRQLMSDLADVKREIREFTHRAASRSHIVRDDGIDGYVELVQLPEALDEAHKVVAADWFRANRYLEFLPTPYDCSGQKFTNWFKLFCRQGHWFAYHSVSVDV